MPSKLYRNGCLVSYADNRNVVSRENLIPGGNAFKIYSINFQAKQKIHDCALIQHYESREQPHLDQFMVTMTYRAGTKIETSNKNITRFCDKLKRKFADDFNYLWVKEYTKKAIPHYHCLMKLPDRPKTRISYKDWVSGYNNLWCKIRGDYHAHAIDMKPVKGHHQSSSYIAKYISKVNGIKNNPAVKLMQEQGLKSNGNVWNASRDLKSEAIPVMIESPNALIYNNYYNRKKDVNGHPRVYEGEFSTVAYLESHTITDLYDFERANMAFEANEDSNLQKTAKSANFNKYSKNHKNHQLCLIGKNQS